MYRIDTKCQLNVDYEYPLKLPLIDIENQYQNRCDFPDIELPFTEACQKLAV